MPSKKKARSKARRATKSRKAKDDDAVNGIDSGMQRLQIGNKKKISKDEDDDEETLLEAAINLAAAEREELEAAAKNEANNSQICIHGVQPLPGYQDRRLFLELFVDEYNACYASNIRIDHIFRRAYEATKPKFAEVWNDPDKIQYLVSCYLNLAVDKILVGDYPSSGGGSAMLASFFEQWAAVVVDAKEAQASCDWNIFEAMCDWSKIVELFNCDEHTLVSFCRKRIPCKCLDSKYKEVKSITKMGICHNGSCSLPGHNAPRSEMLCCTQCRKANYCSRECQVAHWPLHRPDCECNTRKVAALKSFQKQKK